MKDDILRIRKELQMMLNTVHTIKCDNGHDTLTKECLRCKHLIQFGAYLRLVIRKSRRMIQPQLEPLNLTRWIFDTELQAQKLAEQEAKALEL